MGYGHENDIVVVAAPSVLDDLWGRIRTGAPHEAGGSLLEAVLPQPECLAESWNGTALGATMPWLDSQIEAERDPVRVAMMTDTNLEFRRAWSLSVELCGYGDWFDWSMGVWGVHWRDTIQTATRRARSIALITSTPWAPPTVGLSTISEMLDGEIRNRWWCSDEEQCGRQVFVRGAVIVDESQPYHGKRGGGSEGAIRFTQQRGSLVG